MSKKNEKQTIFDTLPETDKDFFIQSLEKKVRNINKKLKEIKQLEIERKEGKELKETQLQKISSKEEYNLKVKELDGIARLYIEAKVESSVATIAAAANAPNPTEIMTEAAIQISHLYYASLFAHQTGQHGELNQAY